MYALTGYQAPALTLGLGFANLGSLLMVDGIPYGSEEGYAICGAITAIMCGPSVTIWSWLNAVRSPA